jgi:hypothetical protein
VAHWGWNGLGPDGTYRNHNLDMTAWKAQDREP